MKLYMNDILDLQTEKYFWEWQTIKCPSCGSYNMIDITKYTQTSQTYHEFLCKDCGAILIIY